MSPADVPGFFIPYIWIFIIKIVYCSMEFIYFSDEWNEKREKKGKIGGSGVDLPRVGPCSAHAIASEEQEEIYQKNKTQK